MSEAPKLLLVTAKCKESPICVARLILAVSCLLATRVAALRRCQRAAPLIKIVHEVAVVVNVEGSLHRRRALFRDEQVVKTTQPKAEIMMWFGKAARRFGQSGLKHHFRALRLYINAAAPL